MTMEGSLKAPERRPIPWRDNEFYDEKVLDSELRRVFDICHGCRRCFNLCDSFPRLFDLIDDSKSGELDTVDSADFPSVIDACTLCDMCFMTKCPYVPPHEFDIDFPHLMLRARAINNQKGGVPFFEKQLTETDRNGKLGCSFSGLSNWGSKCENNLTRPILESIAGIHRDASLPEFSRKTLLEQVENMSSKKNKDAPAYGRKVVLYATCISNYNIPDIGIAATKILSHNGVDTAIVYPECCGMPQLEYGDIERVSKQAITVSSALIPWIEDGYDVLSLAPSCSLMLKFEWPLILPDDKNVLALSNSCHDVSEYIVNIAKNEGLVDGMVSLDGDVTLHVACHARAQNMGQKAAEMLRLIPNTKINVIERCSGHGGSWGIRKENFEVGIKVGRPVAREAIKLGDSYIVSECPLAREQILQGVNKVNGEVGNMKRQKHPIELIAASYGL